MNTISVVLVDARGVPRATRVNVRELRHLGRRVVPSGNLLRAILERELVGGTFSELSCGTRT